MSYTKEQIRTEIRALLNEPSPSFFSNTEIDEWIDLAALDISTKTLCVEASGTVALVSGTLEYNEPSDCIKVYTCLLDKAGLLKIHPRQLAHINPDTSGTPLYYYHFANKLGFYPVPGASVGGHNVTVLFSKQTDDITEIPDEYQAYAIQYGVIQGKIKDGKYGQAAALLTAYLNALVFHRQDLYERGVESKDMQKIPDRTVIED